MLYDAFEPKKPKWVSAGVILLCPPNVNLTPPKKNFFSMGDKKLLLLLGCSLDLVTTSYGEKSPCIWFLGAPGGSKGGSWGSKIKYGSKCLKLPNSSRKVVFSILKFFHLICKILRKISTLTIFLSIFHFGLKFSKLRKPLFSMN